MAEKHELWLSAVAHFDLGAARASGVKVYLHGTAEAEPPVVVRVSLEPGGVRVQSRQTGGGLSWGALHDFKGMTIKLQPDLADWKVKRDARLEKVRLETAVDYLVETDSSECARKVLEGYRLCYSSVGEALKSLLASLARRGERPEWQWFHARIPGLQAEGLITDEEIALFKGEKGG